MFPFEHLAPRVTAWIGLVTLEHMGWLQCKSPKTLDNPLFYPPFIQMYCKNLAVKEKWSQLIYSVFRAEEKSWLKFFGCATTLKKKDSIKLKIKQYMFMADIVFFNYTKLYNTCSRYTRETHKVVNLLKQWIT